MLVNASTLDDYPILSLHVGGEIARVSELIIDPNNLSLIGFRVGGPLITPEIGDLMPIESLREFSQVGIVVDSADEFVPSGEIIRLDNIIKLHFALPGLKVRTRSHAKIGKVTDFTLDADTWQVRQLIVHRPIMKSLLDPELIIAKESIVEVNDYEVIIKDEKEKGKAAAIKTSPEFVPNFVNPFRKPEFAPAPADAEPRSHPKQTD